MLNKNEKKPQSNSTITDKKISTIANQALGGSSPICYNETQNEKPSVTADLPFSEKEIQKKHVISATSQAVFRPNLSAVVIAKQNLKTLKKKTPPLPPPQENKPKFEPVETSLSKKRVTFREDTQVTNLKDAIKANSSGIPNTPFNIPFSNNTKENSATLQAPKLKPVPLSRSSTIRLTPMPEYSKNEKKPQSNSTITDKKISTIENQALGGSSPICYNETQNEKPSVTADLPFSEKEIQKKHVISATSQASQAAIRPNLSAIVIAKQNLKTLKKKNPPLPPPQENKPKFEPVETSLSKKRVTFREDMQVTNLKDATKTNSSDEWADLDKIIKECLEFTKNHKPS
ncbi:hypothetical protein [Candidatus Rhabdochlamydia sp. W815]|uniref:hypothetical protein n=1 Tax=Candidatus Rhabdochlamydia sp. W815 TaxID=2720721 RepID=UPI001BFCAACC|nr:hypothetical protein [Candidatus Rhabdochlamydia sp. W815]